MEYGLLELLGPVFRPVMRPLFTLPGRSTVDNLASFIGDGTVGVLITSRQYEEGYYSRREATVISTTFSVVSITFAIVIASTIKMQDQFFLFLYHCNCFLFNCSNDNAKNLAFKNIQMNMLKMFQRMQERSNYQKEKRH